MKACGREGIDSSILAGRKFSDDPAVWKPWIYRSEIRRKILVALERVPKLIYRKMQHGIPWSTDLLPTLGGAVFNHSDCNIINFHWVSSGLVPISTLRQIRKPIVWTLHDMWPFTGGCHYSGQCTNYLTSCGACPQLASSKTSNLSRLIWRTKRQQWRDLDLTLVSPSRWLAACARKSSLFHQQRIEVIPNGIDTQLYCPKTKANPRAELWLPQEAKLLLFSAMSSTSDRRKGYHLLQPAVRRLAQVPSLTDLPVGCHR